MIVSSGDFLSSRPLSRSDLTCPRQIVRRGGGVLEPRRFVRPDGEGLVLGEIVILVHQLLRQHDVLMHALHVAVENIEGRGHRGLVAVAVEQQIAEVVAVLGGELVDVALQEEEVRRVERQRSNSSASAGTSPAEIGFCR